MSKKTERHRSSVRFFGSVTSTESGRGVVNCQNMAVTGFFLLDISIMSVHNFVHFARGPNWYARTSVCYALCFVWVSSAMCWISASCGFTFLGMVLGGPIGMPGPLFAMLCVLFGFRTQWVYCAGWLLPHNGYPQKRFVKSVALVKSSKQENVSPTIASSRSLVCGQTKKFMT